MRKSRVTETQIVSILKSADAGMRINELCRKHRISEATYYKWKSKHGGMEASDLKRGKELEADSAKLKRMYADLALENTAVKDLVTKNCGAGRETRRRAVSGRGARSPGRSIRPLCGTVAVGLLPGSGGLDGPGCPGDRCAGRPDALTGSLRPHRTLAKNQLIAGG